MLARPKGPLKTPAALFLSLVGTTGFEYALLRFPNLLTFQYFLLISAGKTNFHSIQYC
jgi:hypothetical protein